MTRWQHTLLGSLVAFGGVVDAETVRAETANFELNGKIYTKWLYQNNDSRGCLTLSNPFWKDNLGGGNGFRGGNGVCSEFEVNIKGRVSRYVVAGVRVKSRFGAMWQTWWENGDIRWLETDASGTTAPPSNFYENNSGESLGLNYAQYMKLRGVFLRAALPIPTLRWVHIGATDFGMFNEWTIGKARYIDRDNGSAVLFEGDIADGLISYQGGAIALPRLFVGPNWITAEQDQLTGNLVGFYSNDWAYALKLGSQPIDDLKLTFIASYIHDWEGDKNDPDKVRADGEPQDSARIDERDQAVDLVPRFQGLNSTLDANWSPSFADWLSVNGLLALSVNRVNPEYAVNQINGQGYTPVLFKVDEDGNPTAAKGLAGIARVELFDPLEIGLSAKFEYFNVGRDFNALFGARRESDVLLTDGFLGTGFTRAGQLPTLNIANEFIDFDEPWFESIIAWHGGTAILEYVLGGLRLQGEYTFLTFNSNEQGLATHDRAPYEYPSFFHQDGFTNTYAWTAAFDNSNLTKRGRDPRSVFSEYKDRQSHIMVLNGEYLMPFGNNFVVSTKLKWINDKDDRNNSTGEDAAVCYGQFVTDPDTGLPTNESVRDPSCDDYRGNLYLGFLGVSYQVTDELKTSLGYELQVWNEDLAQAESEGSGYQDLDTVMHTARFQAGYNFGGLTFSYLLEYLNINQEVFRDRYWSVWRSKATVEAGW